MASYPLWSDTNKTLYSSIFAVPEKHVCLLFADGLEKYKYREESEIRTEQTVCIRRVLHHYDRPPKNDSTCDWVFDIKDVRAKKIVDAIVRTCGLPWQLTQCRNIGIIGVPGSYRLELNDSTAIGKAQVYAELFSAKSLPSHVISLFF